MSKIDYRTVAVDDLVPGMILYRMAVTEKGRVVLRAGMTLDEKRIQGLKTWKITEVEIEEVISGEDLIKPPQKQHDPAQQTKPSTLEAEIELLLAEKAPDIEWETQTGLEAQDEPAPITRTDVPVSQAELPENFLHMYRLALLEVKNEFAKARFLRDNFNLDNTKDIVDYLLLPLIEDEQVFWKLQFVDQNEDYLYHHSVDVAILSGCLAKWTGCSKDVQKTVMWGGLLHDVGKALVPLKIINKCGTLTSEEWNIAQRHATRGYKFLNKNFDVPRGVLYCVLQHHERLDGNGYPLSLLADKIDFGARIVAVADIFSAMTSSRTYGIKCTTYEAAATLRENMFGKIDPRICTVFIDNLRQCFRNNKVCLNDGSQAEVVFLNDADEARPMVRTEAGMVVDLHKKRDLSIQHVLY